MPAFCISLFVTSVTLNEVLSNYELFFLQKIGINCYCFYDILKNYGCFYDNQKSCDCFNDTVLKK